MIYQIFMFLFSQTPGAITNLQMQVQVVSKILQPLLAVGYAKSLKHDLNWHNILSIDCRKNI